MPVARLAPDLGPLYEEAAAATARGAKSFYFATRFFPPDLAAAAHAIYWFCRSTDDLVDECADQQLALKLLNDWAALLEEARHRDVHEPMLTVFLDTARRYRIPLDHAFDLIAGVRMVVSKPRYETFDAVRALCYLLGGTVGVMMCSAIGFENPASAERGLPLAADLGTAFQLANVLCKIGEDSNRNRIYLPQDEMERFGFSESELLAHKDTKAFRELMLVQTVRAREYFDRGSTVIPLLHARGRFAVRVAVDIYKQLLRRIQTPGFDFFCHSNCSPPAHRYWFAARHLAAPMVRVSAQRLGLLKD